MGLVFEGSVFFRDFGGVMRASQDRLHAGSIHDDIKIASVLLSCCVNLYMHTRWITYSVFLYGCMLCQRMVHRRTLYRTTAPACCPINSFDASGIP